MKWSVLVAAGLAVLASSGLWCASEPAPEGGPSIWSTAGCGKKGLTLLVNSRIAVMIEREWAATRVAVVRAERVGGSILLWVKGEPQQRVLSLDEFERCDNLPGSLSLLFADIVAVFNELDDLATLCRDIDDIPPPCIMVAARLIDVDGDGAFSGAELRQAMRTATFFVAYQGLAARQRQAFVSLDQLLLAQLAASVAVPFVATHLIDSYDADGDGAVSPKELLQDRRAEQAVQSILSDLVAKAPPAVVSVLMKFVLGFQAPP